MMTVPLVYRKSPKNNLADSADICLTVEHHCKS